MAIAVITSLALAGCRSGATTLPESPTPEISAAGQAPTRTLQTQTALDHLISAARAGDRAAFTSMVSTRDSAFGPRAQMIFENLRVLPLSTLQLTVRPRFANLPDSRRRELGDATWVQEAVLRWQLSSEAAPTEHTVWLTMIVEGQDTRLAGTTDIPGSGRPARTTSPVVVGGGPRRTRTQGDRFGQQGHRRAEPVGSIGGRRRHQDPPVRGRCCSGLVGKARRGGAGLIGVFRAGARRSGSIS